FPVRGCHEAIYKLRECVLALKPDNRIKAWNKSEEFFGIEAGVMASGSEVTVNTTLSEIADKLRETVEARFIDHRESHHNRTLSFYGCKYFFTVIPYIDHTAGNSCSLQHGHKIPHPQVFF